MARDEQEGLGMSIEKRNKVNETLAAMGMRLASNIESGWYVMILVDGQSLRVWATDR